MRILARIKRSWKIDTEESDEAIYQEIQEGIFFRGHNLWLLSLAMLIACVGLNAGSVSAVIGAMLISPLMGPVIGFAFGLSIYSTSMMRLSLYHWGVMVFTSILASTLYFLVTPFHYTTAELDSFTSATIFDVLLAFLGGVAGFLGVIRKEAIKVLAGVAVATACIPPLSTVGYGIANLEWVYVAGGVYFFLVNCFFIGWGTWLSSRFLKFHIRFRPSHLKKKSLLWLYISGFLLLMPSFWLAAKKWQKQADEKNAKIFIEQIQAKFPEIVIVKNTNYRKNDSLFVDMSLLNDQSELSDSLLQSVNQINNEIEAVWHFSPDNGTKEIRLLKNRITRLDSTLIQQSVLLKALQNRIDSSAP